MNKARRAAPLYLAFYGDDLTGSTDALESVTLAGLNAVLFLEPPTRKDLEAYPGIDALGVAGLTRALAPAAMERVLEPAFRALRALKPQQVHYKVCSTFDSSPRLGSIGRAIDVGARIFRAPFVPIVGGAPALGRYCAFGNLFARMGIGSAGRIYRLDRHPSMSRHPATPATESDLRRMLARQTRARIGLVDFTQLDSGQPFRFDPEDDAVLFDALTDAHIARIGEILRAVAARGTTLFTVGPSSVELALGSAMRGGNDRLPPRPQTTFGKDRDIASFAGTPAEGVGLRLHPGEASRSRGRKSSPSPSGSASLGVVAGRGGPSAGEAGDVRWLQRAEAAACRFCDSGSLASSERPGEPGAIADAGPAEGPILVGSGSGSLTTRQQIAWARQQGFAIVAVGPKAPAVAARHLAEGRSVILHAGSKHPGPSFGTELGRQLRRTLELAQPPRVVLAGGDSSSHAARALGLHSLRMVARLTPGAPLCRARAPGSPADGRDLVFKGGQVGGVDYFGVVRSGAPSPKP